MKVVLAAATLNEINTTADWLQSPGQRLNDHQVEVLITGIGGIATASALASAIAITRPDLVIQAGIAGSFRARLAPGTVVLVRDEVLADLGAIEEGELVDIFDLGLAAANDEPFTNRMLVNPRIAEWQGHELPLVRGATVNMISSTVLQASMTASRYDPDVESMEGAALHYVCLMHGVAFLQIRAISNMAGERNKTHWKMKEAITHLNEKLQNILIDLPAFK